MTDLYQSRPGDRPLRLRSPSRGHTRRRNRPLARLLAGGIVLLALSATALAAEPGSHPREKTFMKRQWGVEILYVRQTAAGYMLEFRYKVLDAKKAADLFERQIKPMLTHAETGAKLIVPTPAKTGALRNSNPPKDGNTYWMFSAIRASW